MISTVSCFGILIIAGYLIWLAGLVFFKPKQAVAFLEMFASSARAHFIEMGFRVLAGLAFMGAGPVLTHGFIFSLFGLTLIVTSLVLLLLPWRWHRAFARKVIPGVISQLRLFGTCSFLLGALLAASLLTSVFSNHQLHAVT